MNSQDSMQRLARELFMLKHQAENNLSKKDYWHLYKIIWANRIFLLIGFATAWIWPNPISMVCISLALFGQWTMVAHHACHGGYNKLGFAKRYHSQYFARGWRRVIDWLDWIYPPAWHYEHNILHHFYTNEKIDPDFVLEKIKYSFNPAWPKWLRKVIVYLNVGTWKIFYYSMNTLKAYTEKKSYNEANSFFAYFKKTFYYNYIPYISIHFIFIPFLFLPLGMKAVCFVFINRVGAEILTNIHSFLVIVPNHTGHDMPFQPTHFSSKEEFYVTQIQCACNYTSGGFWRDYLQGYLNYQIEHHLFPDLPMRQYVILQPQVKALCEKYGILYKQESVFKRIKKTFHILLNG